MLCHVALYHLRTARDTIVPDGTKGSNGANGMGHPGCGLRRRCTLTVLSVGMEDRGIGGSKGLS